LAPWWRESSAALCNQRLAINGSRMETWTEPAVCPCFHECVNWSFTLLAMDDESKPLREHVSQHDLQLIERHV